LFEQYLNAGDLDAVMTLYEKEAHFVSQSGETLVDCNAIRKVLGALIDAKTQLHSRVLRAVSVGDIAHVYTDFEGTTIDTSERRFQYVAKQSRSSADRQKAIGG
jgi:hypothetical protein